MNILYTAIKYIGIGLYYAGKGIKSVGGVVEDFAAKRIK